MNWQPFRGDAPRDMTIYSASFPDISDRWPMKDDATREINALNLAVKTDPLLIPPLLENGDNGLAVLIPQHVHSEQAFRTRPALAAWRARLVPSALRSWTGRMFISRWWTTTRLPCVGLKPWPPSRG